MDYTAKLVRGEGVDAFLSQWEAGGVLIRDDLAALYYTTRGRSALKGLESEAGLWELQLVKFGLKEMLHVAFLPTWNWTKMGWTRPKEGFALLQDQAMVELERLLARPLAQSDRERALRLVIGLAKRHGPPAVVEGNVGANRVRVFGAGLVTWERSPHPVTFFQEVAAKVWPIGGE